MGAFQGVGSCLHGTLYGKIMTICFISYRSLQHPNLERLIGVSLDETPIYLVTEYMAKGDLTNYVRSRGRAIITNSNLFEFAKHICKAMVYLESKNFIHRYLSIDASLASYPFHILTLFLQRFGGT